MNSSQLAKKTLKYLQQIFFVDPKLRINESKQNKHLIQICDKKKEKTSFKIYYGQVKSENVPHDSNGVVIYQNGDFYVGNIQNGIIKGNGKISKHSIETADQIFSYQGLWIDNLPNGKGIQKIGQKIKYKGDFVNGKKQGTGILDFGNGTKYIGQFKNNEICGQGKYTTLQNQWQGTWKDGYLQGKGQQTILGSGKNNNSFYDGYFKNGYKQGKGCFIWGSGKQYHGQFSKGQLNGTGKLKVGNKQFVGKWQNGLDTNIQQGVKGSNIHMKLKNKDGQK